MGVAADVIHGWVFEGRDRTCIYLPVWEGNAKQAGQMLVLFRGDENAGLRRLRERIAARWPDFEGDSIPMSAVLSLQIYPFRAAAWIGWVLGLVAMALSVSGMYGVMSYLVNQRSKEIGIRMALGASPAGVVAMVMRRSLWLAGLGVLIGGVLAGGVVKLLLWWSAGLGVLLVGQLRASVRRGAGGQRRGAGSARPFEPRRPRRSEYGSARRLDGCQEFREELRNSLRFVVLYPVRCLIQPGDPAIGAEADTGFCKFRQCVGIALPPDH